MSETPEDPQDTIESPKIEETPSAPIPLSRSHKKKILKIIVKKPAEKIVEVDTLEEAEELTYKQKYEELMKSKVPKEKKQKTPAQMAAWAKALETRKTNAIKRKEEMQKIADSQRTELEKKIIKKAISIKKRELRSRIALESIPDDDEPVEEVLAKTKHLPPKTPKAVVPPTPVWTFV